MSDPTTSPAQVDVEVGDASKAPIIGGAAPVTVNATMDSERIAAARAKVEIARAKLEAAQEKAEGMVKKPTPDEAAAAAKKKKRNIIIAVCIFLVIGIGIGVGVGVGVGTKKSSSPAPVAIPVYSVVSLGAGVTGKTYFIQAEKGKWDYAPKKKNMCYNDQMAAMFMPPGTDRVGGVFVKARYAEYKDSSFTTPVARPAEWFHLGNVGPVMNAAVGDVIRVVFRNNLTFPVNLAPAGGLVAWDSASNTLLKSYRVAPVKPGQTVTYLWRVPPEAGPVANSTVSSRMWLYKSTVDPTAHDNAGLIGPIIVTTAENANAATRRAKDVDREVVAIFQIVQEKASPFLYENDQNQTSGTSFTKMAINGYTWCNMDPSALTFNTSQKIRWHIGSVGSIDSIHNYHWHGHVVELNGHHVDQFTGIPAATYSVNMVTDEPGTWMFHCHVNFHMDGGMVNLYRVVGPPAPLPVGGMVRTYYVKAEEIEWSYTGPNNEERCMIPAGQFVADPPEEDAVEGNQFVNGPSVDPVRLGPTYTKTIFREYTDASFTTIKPRPAEDAYLGYVGPIMRATIGDTIKIVLRNEAKMNVSMHPHGVRYSKSSEGTLYEDYTTAADKGDDIVQPGTEYTYTWLVPERSGPGPADPDSMFWMYHSHLDETADTYAGLLGAVVVTPRDKIVSMEDPRPKDVDRELIIFFNVVDEAQSSNFRYNLETKLGDNGVTAAAVFENATTLLALRSDPDFAEHMLKHAINGYMFCNMPELNYTQGDKVRLYVMVLGTVEDMHTPNLNGPSITYNNQQTDAFQMAPGGMATADVVMTQPGSHFIECRVADHVASGMRAWYHVEPSTRVLATKPTGVERVMYIQAEPVYWDYAPNGYQNCTNMDLRFSASQYLRRTATTIGSKYQKAVYREYTDATFKTRKEIPPYYGMMGPMILVEVGDKLTVHFRNALDDLPDEPLNISPGGGLVPIGGDGENCAEVLAGNTCVYRWLVPDVAGPGSADFNTAVYGYTSTVKVINSPPLGLVGVLVVAAQGELVDGLPKGVDAMIPLYWQAVNENLSPYIGKSAELAGINLTTIEASEDLTEEYEEGNIMRSINGFSYCNMPKPIIKKGKTLRWVLVAYGTEGDMHAPYFQGQTTVVDRSGYNSLASLMPSVARNADMIASDVGTWLLYCDVHAHFDFGMMAQFTITA
ncbi:hypothetical protein HYH03_003523 [Edaphochlamys debaryana]|uniref:Uncharacterized protein n=1 Tax=Edaphochlamys debaryana TaxID=47281 RepID=A0A835YJG1_9CHLO|nr:hypothetical protein HYH03_003523 [Edaphochlamys debaryana]|eukprot:KAG2498784.1 hypothetical protein HYH03_003523 [Edaphochlamys debaryana]